MERMQTFDAIVIGAGSGGLTTAVGLAKIGRSVLLIEREHIGGECTNSGCIPSKALLHYAKTYAAAIAVSGTNANSELYRRAAFTYVRRKIAETLAHETPAHFAKLGITVVMGEAVFANPQHITVGTTDYRFSNAIIATGSSPRLIDIPGLSAVDTLTNQNIFNLDDVPKRTLIIGGGPIGMEMGQSFALLGSHVTIIDTGSTLAKLEDPAIAAIIQTTFAKSNITFIGNARVTRVEYKVATIETEHSNEPVFVAFDKVLIVIGRVPNIPTGIGAANVSITESGITVDQNYQTTNRRIYALGDVTASLKFTHVADDIARQVVTRIATYGLTTIKIKAIPKVIFTEPELAQVGLSHRDAEKKYGKNNIHRIEVPYSENDRARTDSNESGVLVVLARRLSGKIIGAHIAGAHAGELLTVFTIAIDNNLSLWKLRQTIYTYPTYGLIIKKAGDYFFTTQIGTLRTDLVELVRRHFLKALLGILWILGLTLLYRYQMAQDHSVTDTALTLFDFISLTAFGPLIYILAYTIRPITFIPGTILTILSGVFFGLWGGIVYTIIGANLSATLAYCIGRYFGGSTTKNSVGLLSRFVASCRSNPFMTVLTMRLIFLPYDGVNYGAGFLKIPYLPYIGASIVGTLLGIVTFVSIGASISIDEFRTNGIGTAAIDSTFLLLSVIVFVTSLGIAKMLTKKKGASN